jgi:hypothetical protein
MEVFRRPQWPRVLRHELSSVSQTLGSWVQIPREVWKSVGVYSVCVVLCVGSGLCDGLIHRPRSTTVCVKKIRKLKKRSGPKKGL